MALEPTFSRCAEWRLLPELSGASCASLNPLRQTAPCQRLPPLLGCLLPARPHEVLGLVLSQKCGLLSCPSSSSRTVGVEKLSKAACPSIGSLSGLQPPPQTWTLKWSVVLVLSGRGGLSRRHCPRGCCDFHWHLGMTSMDSEEARGWRPSASCLRTAGDSPFPSRWPSAINQEINNLPLPSQNPPLPFPVESPACLGTSQSGPPSGGPW